MVNARFILSVSFGSNRPNPIPSIHDCNRSLSESSGTASWTNCYLTVSNDDEPINAQSFMRCNRIHLPAIPKSKKINEKKEKFEEIPITGC